MVNAIEVSDISKQFVLRHTRSIKEAVVWLVKGRKGDLSEKFHALKNVTVEVKTGETVALLGLNGSVSPRCSNISPGSCFPIPVP